VAHDVPSTDGPIAVELRDLGAGASTLDPWPFGSDSVEVRCEARRLIGRYTDEDELRRAFGRAEPLSLTFALEAS
jgi:hypothetical protein